MYLMDSVAQTAAAVAKMARPDPLTDIFPDLVRRLAGAPRFLFDDAATRTVVELTLGRPKVLREAMAHLVIPYPRLWVEWPEAARDALRRRFTVDAHEKPGRPIPDRIGFLLEGEDDRDWNGRHGRVTWLWAGRTVPVPNVGAIEARFDLDASFPTAGKGFFPAAGKGHISGDVSAMTNNLWRYWGDNPRQRDALGSIWATAEHLPSRWGAHYLRGLDAWQVANCLADVFGEYITVWSCLMLLTASRPIVALQHVDPVKLNKRRRRKGETPLLSHTRVSLHLGPQTVRPVVRAALGYSRKSPRVHLVSSYLARRGAKHWIVSPYLRGVGETIHRVVQVKG